MQGTDVEQEPAARCPECGQAHGGGAKFCSECGTRLAAEPERETRKTVTAVFADVIGSTPLQERIDAEAAHHVMDRFYHAMREVLEAHDGRVAKFIGDAVVAIFGVPAVREDDALRAVQAAGAMRDALAVLNDELERDWGVRIGMRVGVNTGEVVISPEGLAVGDAMNTAARLEQTAGDGEILIGETTSRHVRHAATCEPVAPLTLKGKREPVTAYLLVHAPATGGQQRARIEAPLVGRDPELRRLLDAFDDAVREQSCRLVTVVGSPGLGKTRLAEELTASVADRATVVQGRCEPTGEGITFLPVAEVLRGAAQIGEADEPAVVRAKLAALLPGDPDAELLVERAGGVLGIAKPATAEETFWSVRRLLGGLARERPLVVVLDDVHWGQPTFLDLVEHLVEWARQAPILILALARPELRDMRPALTDPDGIAADVVELVPLADEHCRDLVRELLDQTDVPEALADRVLQTTGGNPLFLGETLRMFVDDGVLRREGDGWVATIDADAVEVPPTITALLAARIERLGAAERSVVERAAVIGKQFYRGAVADLAPPLVAAGIDAHLRALHRKEVVEPDGTTWIDEPVFRFHHVLIRDAAYRALLKDARAELHERFADWLADKAGALVGEHEEVIAFHLEQAYEYRRELGPLDERGRALGERAVALLHATGRRALEREDLPAATNLLGRAADVLADASPGAADVLIDLLEALLSVGQADEVAQVAERLQALEGHGERPRAWATIATAQLAQLTGATGVQDSLAEIASAGEALTAAGDDGGVAKAHHVRAQALALLGQVADVEAALDQALAAARRGGDTRRATAVLSGAPRAALWGPSPVMRSSGRCLDVVRILRMTQGNRHVEAIALRCQAVLEAMRGRAEAGRQILDRCRMTLEELGLRLELLETEHYAGIVELVAGDHAAAEARLRTAHDGFAQRGLDVGAAATAALLARALVEQGRDEEAEELTRFSEERGRENLKTTIAWCSVRARVLARRGEHAEAEVLAGRAVALADGTDALVDHGDARLDLARVLRAAGEEERALAEARRAAELYEAKGHEAGAARAAAFAHEERRPRELSDADALPKGLPAERYGGLLQRVCAAISDRDEDTLLANITDDVVVRDRRPASPRGDSHDAVGFMRSQRAFWAASDDVRCLYSQLVEAGTLGLGYEVYSGHSRDGGGEFVLPMLMLTGAAGGRAERFEVFLPEDERAALDRLVELHPDADERVAWSAVLDAMAAFNARDLGALGAPFAEAYAGLPEGRMSVEIVATAGAQAVMSRLWIDAEPPVEELGQIVTVRDGVAVDVELFDAGDESRMRERFAALGGEAHRAEPLPTRRGAAAARAVMDTACQRQVDALCDAGSRRDWAALRSCLANGFEVTDRRGLALLPEAQGVDGWIAYVEVMTSLSSDGRVTLAQFAGDDRVGATTGGWKGHHDESGSEFSLDLSVVVTVGDDGIEQFDYFDADDQRGVADRLLELQPDADLRATWRAPLELVLAFNARYWDALRACCDAAEPIAEDLRSLAIAMPDARAAVHFLEGATSRVHVYGSETETTLMLAGGAHGLRHAALEGASSTEVTQPGRVAQWYAAHCEAFNARDWDALLELWAEDIVLVDRRAIKVWPVLRGNAELLAMCSDMLTIDPDVRVSVDIFESDDECAIADYRFTGHAVEGGAEFEVGAVEIVVFRNGLASYGEFFDDDEPLPALRDRREELRPLARRRPGTGLPDEPLVTEGWLLQVLSEADRAAATGVWDAFRRLISADVFVTDHRRVPTMKNTTTRDEFVAYETSLGESTTDLRRPHELLAASATTAAAVGVVEGRMVDGGGPFELPFGVVFHWRAGVATHIEFFDPADEEAMLVRFAELDTSREGGGAVEAMCGRVRDASNARDWAGLEACFAPGVVFRDRRPIRLWGDIRGATEMVDLFRTFQTMLPDVEDSFERIEADDEIGIVRWATRGHATTDDGGGMMEDVITMVHVVSDGRLLHGEVFSPDADIESLRARAEELRPLTRRRPGAELPEEPLAPEVELSRFMVELHRGGITGRWDGLREVLAPDFHAVDRRRIRTFAHDGTDGREAFIARERSLAASSYELQRPYETLAASETHIAAISLGHGRMADGDGPFESHIGGVFEWRDGIAQSVEFFEPEDKAGMLARFRELS